MALKDYNTSELQAEITRRAHRCPICATLQVQLDEVAGALGAARMDGAGGYHYEAVSQLVRERDHYAKACVAAMQCMAPVGARGCPLKVESRDRSRDSSCNYEHIGIAWTSPGPCPLCACFERIEELESALRAAADSLGTLAVASNQNGFEDLIDVRGYANSRWTVACELLPETKCRCSRCGCLPTRHRRDDEELRECLDCECTEYES